jgi:hypothetical protein
VTDDVFYVYVFFSILGLPFYVGKGCNDRDEDHEKDTRRGEARAVHDFIRAMANRREPLRKVRVFTKLENDWALDLETAIVEKFGMQRHGGLLMNRQRPRKCGATPKAVAHIKKNQRLLRLPVLEAIRVTWIAAVTFDALSGGSEALKTVHPSGGAKLWLDEDALCLIDMFRNGRGETFSDTVFRLEGEAA